MPEISRTDAEHCRRAALHALSLDAYQLDPVSTVAELAAACSLVHDAYVGLGICSPKPTGMLVSPQHLDPETVVFLARSQGRVVGTISVIFDGPAGLPLDKDYPDVLTQLRRTSRRLCEIGSLAVDPDHRKSAANALLAMAALWSARHVGAASHCVIGVHPRATGHYRALYGFQRFGEAQTHCALEAPVAGLVLELARLEDHLRAGHPWPMATGRRVHEHTCHELPPCIRAPQAARRRLRQVAMIPVSEHEVEHAAHR